MAKEHTHICDLSNPAHPRVKDVPQQCSQCSSPLCLRKQVVNLALGNTESMLCLRCLGKDADQSPGEILEGLMHYIQQRECFLKEWSRYESIEFCPDRNGCVPDICFGTKR